MITHQATAPSSDPVLADVRRLRSASIVFHLASLLLITFPLLSSLGLHFALHYYVFYGQGFYGESLYLILIIALWLRGGLVLARDPHLKLLMPFGSRSVREAMARTQNASVMLDELDFHLRGEAFRISYQAVTTLVSMVGIAGLLLSAAGIYVEWHIALLLTFPFGVFWLLALPTTVLVWLRDPAGD